MEHYVNIMLDSGFKAALYDEREVMQFLLYLPYDLPSRREGPGVEIRPAPGIWNLPLNFSLPEFPSWRTDVVLANEQTGRIRLKQIYVSFERFDLRYEECVTPLEKTIYVLKNMNLFDMSPLKEKEAHFRRLLDVANLGALTPQERAIYDENLKIYRDWKATMEYAVENAEAKGEVRGSRLITLRTALNLKRIGLDPSVIAQCTGLSLEEINDLENLIRKEEIKC